MYPARQCKQNVALFYFFFFCTGAWGTDMTAPSNCSSPKLSYKTWLLKLAFYNPFCACFYACLPFIKHHKMSILNKNQGQIFGLFTVMCIFFHWALLFCNLSHKCAKIESYDPLALHGMHFFIARDDLKKLDRPYLYTRAVLCQTARQAKIMIHEQITENYSYYWHVITYWQLSISSQTS